MRRQRTSLNGLFGGGRASADSAGRRLLASLALSGGACLAACSGNVGADDGEAPQDMPAAAVDAMGNPLPPGAVVNEDGTVTNPDGTPLTNPDGSPVIVGAPGTNPDGTPVTNPDGTPATNPDGTPVTNPDGTPSNPNGTPVTAESDCEPGVPGTSQLPRLTKQQYDNTIRDLVGITSNPSALLAPDTPGSVDQRAWDGYQAAAEAVAAQVMEDPTAKAKALPCTPEGDGLACAQQFVSEFGLKAFRRPLSEAEAARYLDLYANKDSITETGSFDEIAQVMLRAFLVSPTFLTRAELSEATEGEYYKLDAYEVASRLSYMLWASMPDETLFAAAANGELQDAAQILAQATRMLEDEKAHQQVAKFHERYALMGPGTRWAEIDRDPTIYPAFDQAMVPLISEETSRLFDYTVFEAGGRFQDLLLTQTAFVNALTAPLYGLNAADYGSDLTQVELDGTRPGVFTRVGFLTSHSKFDRSSPILRGAFLQKEVLCTEIPAPPPGANGVPFPTELATNRERTDAQTNAADCVTCHHQVINPTGFTLEAFDGIGAVQTTDNGSPINTVADVPIGSEVVEVQDAVDLMTRIANAPAAQRCYAEKWVEYAYERAPNSADACLVDAMSAQMAAAGEAYSVLDLIADLTQSDSFRYRAVQTEVAQ